MKLYLKIRELDYVTLAIKALPFLKQKAAGSPALTALVSELEKLPADLIGKVFDAVPDDRKNEIASQLISENEDRILRAVNTMSAKHHAGIIVSALSLQPDLTAELVLDRIDFRAFFEALSPDGSVKNAGFVLRGAAGLSGLLSQRQKETWAVRLINTEDTAICAALTEWLMKNGIRARICCLTASPG